MIHQITEKSRHRTRQTLKRLVTEKGILGTAANGGKIGLRTTSNVQYTQNSIVSQVLPLDLHGMAGQLETAPKSRFAGGMHNLRDSSRCQHADMRHKAADKAKLVLPTPSCTERCSPTDVPVLEAPSMR